MSTSDASSSWSGYQYQGKVSLFIVLKLINKLINESKEEEIQKFSIEIENREDFAIKYEKGYKSFHQVKARLSDVYLNNYLEAITKMNEEKEKFSKSELYLHTCVAINDWNLNKYNSLLEEKIETLETQISNSDQDKCKDKLKKLEELKELYKDVNKFKNVNLYDYYGKKYCSLDEIISFIKDQLGEYFKQTNQNGKLGNIDIIYYKLICFIDEYIKDRHNKSANLSIGFTDFKDILDNDDLLKRDRLYHLSIIKDKYSCLTFYKYCENICDIKTCNKSLSDCNISSIIEYIDNISLYDLEKLLTKFNPHVLIEDWETDRSKLEVEKGIFFLYRTIINELNSRYQIQKNSVMYEASEKVYLPTTINYIEDYLKPHSIEEYRRNVTNNDPLLRELFEANIFITSNLNSGNILDGLYEVDEIEEPKRLRDEQMGTKKYLSNEIFFKDIESVKKEIKQSCK